MKGKSEKAFKHNLKTEMKHGHPKDQSLAIAYNMKRKSKKAHGGYADGEDVKPKPTPAPNPYDMSRLGPTNPKVTPNTQATDDVQNLFRSRAGHSQGGMACPSCGYAEGGQITDNYQSAGKPNIDREFGHEHAEFESGFMKHPGNDIKHNSMAMHESGKGLNQHPVDMREETEHADDEFVDRIMHKKSMDYHGLDRLSEGGKVANQEHGEDNNELAGFSPNEFDDLVLRDDLESTYGDDDNAGDALGNDQEDEDRADIIARIMRSRAKKDKLPRPA